MKILYFYQYFGTPKGSWGTRVYEFARRWVAAGHEVTVVTSVYDKSDLTPKGLFSRFDCDGIDVRVINIKLSNRHGLLARIAGFLGYAVLSCGYALTLPADVVVASSGPQTAAIPGLLARYLRRRRLVLEVRDILPECAVQTGVIKSRGAIAAARALEWLSYRAAHGIVALSPGMAEWIAMHHGLRKPDVVPNAADNDLVRPPAPGELPDWTRTAPMVVYTGTLGVANDCRQILDTAAELQRRGRGDVRLVIVGDGKQRAQLMAEAESRGLDNVHFAGLITREACFTWLTAAAASLIVLQDIPIFDTACPNKLFDAFAAGTPVIQTTQGWIRDILERERCGLTVRAGDASGMADAIAAICGNPELRAEFSRNARRLAQGPYERGRLADAMLAALQRTART